MIQINLLPIRATKSRDLTAHFPAIYLACVFIALATIAFLWVSTENEIEGLRTKLAGIEKEVAKYAKFEQALQQLTKRKEIIDKKRQTIKELKADRDAVVRMLALLSIQVPLEKMWFNKLAQVGNSVTLDGVAQSNEAIVEFMRKLESSAYVEKGSTNLVLSKQLPMNDMKLRDFQITYRFLPFSEVQKKSKM